MSQQSCWSHQLIGVTLAGFFPPDWCNFTVCSPAETFLTKLLSVSWCHAREHNGALRDHTLHSAQSCGDFQPARPGAKIRSQCPPVCVSAAYVCSRWLSRPRPMPEALVPLAPDTKLVFVWLLECAPCGTLRVFKEGGGGWRGVPDRAAAADSCGQRPVQWQGYVMCGMSQPKEAYSMRAQNWRAVLPARTKLAPCCCSCAMVTIYLFI